MKAGAGLDQARLARLTDFLDEAYIAPGRLPGAQLGLWRRGELAYQNTQGFADIAAGRRLRGDAIFRIYSMTKPITALAFMMLVEDGKVALDDPVHRYIPAWKDLPIYESGAAGAFVTRPSGGPMRIIDLLRHTSGLTYDLHDRNQLEKTYGELRLAQPHGPLDMDGFVEALSSLPLAGAPGEVWNYSISNDVVGYLIGLISGMPFEVFLKTKIFDPLGMSDTDFHVRPEKAHRFTTCYYLDKAGQLAAWDEAASSKFLSPPNFHSGAAGSGVEQRGLSAIHPPVARPGAPWRGAADRAEDV